VVPLFPNGPTEDVVADAVSHHPASPTPHPDEVRRSLVMAIAMTASTLKAKADRDELTDDLKELAERLYDAAGRLQEAENERRPDWRDAAVNVDGADQPVALLRRAILALDDLSDRTEDHGDLARLLAVARGMANELAQLDRKIESRVILRQPKDKHWVEGVGMVVRSGGRKRVDWNHKAIDQALCGELVATVIGDNGEVTLTVPETIRLAVAETKAAYGVSGSHRASVTYAKEQLGLTGAQISEWDDERVKITFE
jgi:hypothetical protein